MERHVLLMACLIIGACDLEPSGGNLGIVCVDTSAIHVVSQAARFAMVRGIVPDAEAVWVLDGFPPHLTRVSGTGEVGRFGGKGQGPGEFLNPWAIQPTKDSLEGGIRVWDLGLSRVSVIDSLGAFQGSEALSQNGLIRSRSDIRDVSYIDPFRVRNLGGDVAVGSFAGRLNRTVDFQTGVLRRARPTLEPRKELVRFSDHAEGDYVSPLEWAAVPLWDACDGALVLWSPARRQVSWIDPDGLQRGFVAVDRAETAITNQDVERYLRWMGRLESGPDHNAVEVDFGRMARAVRDLFATAHPGPVDLLCESRETVWLRLFGTSVDPLGKGTNWLRVTKDGIIQELMFPDDFIPMAFTPEGAFGIREMPEGFQLLAQWSYEGFFTR